MKNSDATLNNSLYDHYIRAFRWASDRIGDSGIVCFVSNGGWLTGAAGAGVRRCFKEEFNSIYVYNLRGNQRTQGEESRREGGKIFASGSRATIAITMLVKTPNSDENGAIHYHDIGDYLTRDEKFRILKEAVDHDPEWTTLDQDKHGDWLDQRDDSYLSFIPMGVQEGVKKLPTGLFSTWSAGVKTQRDVWTYNFSKPELTANMKKTITFFNTELKTYQETAEKQLPRQTVKQDESSISWSEFLYSRIKRNKKINFNDDHISTMSYRPFCKTNGWFDTQINDRPGLQPQLFPYRGAKNLEIIVSERGAFITHDVPDLEVMHHGQCFPLYWYEEAKPSDVPVAYNTLFGDDQGTLVFDKSSKGEQYVRHDAITDAGLKVFQEAYPEIPGITKEDIFYYVYGILHSREYRRRFGNNLAKELPRIPLAMDFPAFRDAGRKLAKLHLGYEKVKPWEVTEFGDSTDPGRTVKMTYPRRVTDPETGKKVKDLTVLQVAENLTIEGIPPRAYEYVVNGKTAIGWLIDRYQITTDKKSGIVNDPNEYSPDPRYIVDLVEKVIRVSVETVDIMNGLPALNEKKTKPTCWPKEWNK